MKSIQNKNKKVNGKFNANRHIPENKDDIDSRHAEEQLQEGNKLTKHVKERRAKKT